MTQASKIAETVAAQLSTPQTPTPVPPSSFGNSDLGLLIAFAMAMAVFAKILGQK